jgi:cyclic pyranopterin phosphate synthase|tara:strand:+ start:60 stop:1070 length:1011 start_codon:yes stop_codon:yes gene_type:complete
MNITDKFSRKLRDVRISVTDRCNFRCAYCMPKEVFDSNYKFFKKKEILSFEEIIRLTKILASLGVRKVRLTGGEPLLRNNIHALIENIKNIDGITDISMTTNGVLLTEKKALTLKNSGLDRITISLDSLSIERFGSISGSKYAPKDVLSGVDNAKKAGFKNIKINMVVKKDVNDHDILPMLDHFYGSGCIVRFIEFMDVGNVNFWNKEQVTSLDNIIHIISNKYEVRPMKKNYNSEVAKRWSYSGGEFGIISSISNPFCGDCSRIRLTAEGKLFTCLFADKSYDIKSLVRSPRSDSEIQKYLIEMWSQRDDRYSEERVTNRNYKVIKKAEMSYIGG